MLTTRRLGRLATLFLCGIMLLLPLVSCRGNDAPNETGEVYRGYVMSHGRMACTSSACVYAKGEWVYYLPNDMSATAEPLCFKPECTHTDESCSAYIGGSDVYSYNDKLYFIEETSGGFRLCEMSARGEERRAVRRLPMLDVGSGGTGYTADVRSGYLVLSTTSVQSGAPCREVWLIDVRDPKAEPVRAFSNDGNLYRFEDIADGDAYFVKFTDGGAEEIQLISYSISTGEIRVLVENWARENCMHADNGTLYWYAPGEGFFSMELASGEPVMHRAADRAAEYGVALYDERYIYFSNAIPALDLMSPAPEGKRGLTVYDLTGSPLVFIPSPASETPAGIYFETITGDKALLHSVSGDNTLPEWYINKADIEGGSAELIPVPDSSRP